ncbi:MAG: hypothetical protein IM526_02840 [Microcystis sp. M38BS1]|uniref:hypothetical protein n=1 Tax=Microcystis sp. M38BS1 TaxID=2771188 RepID=UPI0031FBD393|nr:hypothetical protein [Microcystis sp. M38BS1]MCA6582598.1 hypothetical protein [Pseudanabaena sp. M34BS1SP1A06MG]
MDDEQDLGAQEAGVEGEGQATELNPTNAFGELLLDLIEAQYEGDIDAGVQALVQSTGLSEEDVVGYISGENIVDNVEDLEAMISAFPDATEEDLDKLIEVADGVLEQDRQALEAQYETAGTEGEEDPVTQQGADYAAAYNPAIQANFNRSVAAEIQRVRAENEALHANFAQAQFEAQLSQALTDLNARISQDVVDGVITPAMKEALIGNFADPRQRVAQFTGIAQTNGARDLQEQLNMSEFAYSLLRNVANVTQFTDFSVSAEEVATANFSASLEEAAKGDLVAMGLDFGL